MVLDRHHFATEPAPRRRSDSSWRVPHAAREHPAALTWPKSSGLCRSTLTPDRPHGTDHAVGHFHRRG